MTIQVGLSGPPSVSELRLRVWTDRTDDSEGPVVRFAGSGRVVPDLAVEAVGLPAELSLADESPPRRLFEIGGWPQDELLTIGMGPDRATVLTPPAEDGELRLMIGSCYYRQSDRGKLRRSYESLRPHDRPHVRIHAGDQIYLDAERLDGAERHLERTLEPYREYWADPSYGPFLRGGISLFTPDDHDFWNDYPYSMPHLARSYHDEWRGHRDAARIALAAYQTLGNPDGRSSFAIDLGLVSLFVLDTRSLRGDGGDRGEFQLFDPVVGDALMTWSRELEKPGILVSAMPLYQKPKGKFLGLVTTDHNLLAYEDDAALIWEAVEGAEHDVIVLTGDIHQGRLSEWITSVRGVERKRIELVASPLSILTWWMSGRPNAKPPPTVKVESRVRRIRRTFWGLANQDHFGLLKIRPAIERDSVKARFELRSTREGIPGGVATSEYAQRGQKIVRSWGDGGRIPCMHETVLS